MDIRILSVYSNSVNHYVRGKFYTYINTHALGGKYERGIRSRIYFVRGNSGSEM